MSTTSSVEALSKPEMTARQMAEAATWLAITEGSEKQIKFAQELREKFLRSDGVSKQVAANVRWAVIKQAERGERLEKSDIAMLATDAWNRRTVEAINTSNAKTIIDWFVGLEADRRRLDSLGRYEHIITYPQKWEYSNGWKRISYK